jgi:hypothetical protein
MTRLLIFGEQKNYGSRIDRAILEFSYSARVLNIKGLFTGIMDPETKPVNCQGVFSTRLIKPDENMGGFQCCPNYSVLTIHGIGHNRKIVIISSRLVTGFELVKVKWKQANC